jgi:hypothetical protein
MVVCRAGMPRVRVSRPAGIAPWGVTPQAARGVHVLRGTYSARRASTSNAGNVLPSSTSRNAPPPVEM